MAITTVISGGMRNNQRHLLAPPPKEPTAKPARMRGARLLMATCPSWIMNPKMPEKVPRSLRLNQAALILIIPGAPNDWKYPLTSQTRAKVEKVPAKEANP